MATPAGILASCTSDENGMDDGAVKLRLTSGVEVQQTCAFTPTQNTSIKPNEVVNVWGNDAGTMPGPPPYMKPTD